MSKIQWAEQTWNPVTGCTRVSAGCDHCYAATMSRRLQGMGNHKYDGIMGRTHFNGVVRTHPEELGRPLRWRKPRTIFVNSMSDLFHPSVPFEFIDKVFAVMALCPQHTYQVLTKRPERAAEYFNQPNDTGYKPPPRVQFEMMTEEQYPDAPDISWPLPNVWLGTSVEDQRAADERIPHLLRCPATVRFLSCEPLLGAVDLGSIQVSRWVRGDPLDGGAISTRSPCNTVPNATINTIHWVIAGGESGPGARPCNLDWLRSLRDQCQAAGVAFFVKQLGAKAEGVLCPQCGNAGEVPTGRGAEMRPCPRCDGNSWFKLDNAKGGDMEEWPEDLRVREMPEATVNQ